jgi:hypothetical protein
MPETRFRINAPAVIHERFDDELVAINLDTGVYHSLAGPAADAFQLLSDGASKQELADQLANKYAASSDVIAAALTPFFDQLRKEDLICEVENGNGAAPLSLASAGPRVPFTAPTLEAYRDLQSLFLLDPVHEVGEEGWPSPASGSPET